MNDLNKLSASHSAFEPDPVSDRFLSPAQCDAVADRIFKMQSGGGSGLLNLRSSWVGNLRWARNRVTSGGETQSSRAFLIRVIRGAVGRVMTNTVDDDTALRDAVRRAEAQTVTFDEDPEQYPEAPPIIRPHTKPTLWFDSTYKVDATERGHVAAALIEPARVAKVSAAGYVETSASGFAVLNTDGLRRYYPYTTAQYSVTVRDAKTGASGWAGVDFNDWARIDAAALTARAVDKCLRSRNPVAVEPGRYTVILEPQAVCDLLAPLIERALDREAAERGAGPFAAGGGNSKIGERVADPRITISADPMDPDCGSLPFDGGGEPFLKVDWIEQGILKELSYNRMYGLRSLIRDQALPNSFAFRVSGGTSTIDEMIATTQRGIVVTRFNNVQILDLNSMLMSGNTRDGLWLVERGKISKPIKNFRFTDSPMFMLNNIEQLGAPQRTFRPTAPAVCPPMKVRDFGFSSLMDAV